MPPAVWAAIAAYFVIISAVAVGITVYDKKIAVKNGRIEEAANTKKQSRGGSKSKPTNKSASKKGGSSKSAPRGNSSGGKTPSAIRRIPEKTLLIIAGLGGSIAMLITMHAIRHKTQHAKFMVGIPAIIVAQCAAAVALAVLR